MFPTVIVFVFKGQGLEGVVQGSEGEDGCC